MAACPEHVITGLARIVGRIGVLIVGAGLAAGRKTDGQQAEKGPTTGSAHSDALSIESRQLNRLPRLFSRDGAALPSLSAHRKIGVSHSTAVAL
jgi:hypothetical protein